MTSGSRTLEALPPIELSFNGEPIREEIASENPDLRRPDTIGHRPELGYAFAQRVDDEIEKATGEYWRTSPYDGSGTGGPVFDSIQLLVDHAASWITIGVALFAGIRWLATRSGQPVMIGEGAALVIARNAVYKRTQLDDLSPAFTTHVGSRAKPTAPDGWAVGLRSDTDLWIVVVDYGGEVHGFTSIEASPVMGPVSW